MSDLLEDEAVAGLAALGSAPRLRLFRLLVRAGEAGANATDLGRRLGIPASTLAHHLAALTRAGLVRQTRRGREVLCTAAYDRVAALSAYLTESCCAGLAAEAACGAAA
ncbi:MAG: transcriptional regulator [Phenylobacterium sp.]|uniref:ArsR/SmtB family transcription factor n=1 Tax=Phenylobacterium sp. TaxID=1871053 RepID=UPI0012266CD5|nr:metalloregulator ArsR/SmtB family transcription factor [Phenylobacterium sp.]TAJ69890.1 MAG: transcriptional regulator [Phenylobacterium sp.]